MLVLPFLFGLAASRGELIHIPLFVCWFFIYLFSFPVLQWIKTGSSERYRKPAVVYGVILLPLLISLIWFEPALIWYGVLLLLFLWLIFILQKRKMNVLYSMTLLQFYSFVLLYTLLFIWGRRGLESSNRAILTFDALLYRNCFVCQNDHS